MKNKKIETESLKTIEEEIIKNIQKKTPKNSKNIDGISENNGEEIADEIEKKNPLKKNEEASKQSKKKQSKKKKKKDGIFDTKLNYKKKKKLNLRFLILFFLFIIFFTIIIARVAHLEITHTVGTEDLQEYGKIQVTKPEVIPSHRGTIYDKNGEPLAVNMSQYHVRAVLDPENQKYDEENQIYKNYYVKDADYATQKTIQILGYQNNEEAKKLISEQYHKDPNKVKQVEFGQYGAQISIDQKEQLEKAQIGGLYFDEIPNRYYPYGEFASYILGYSSQSKGADEDSQELTGQMGIEKYLDPYLTGKDGFETSEVDSLGVSSTNTKEIFSTKTDGSDVYLTIDSTIQTLVHDSMQKALKGKDYDRASTVVMDAKTGEILGAESFPTFNPNTKDVKDYQDPFYETCFEPGSTIKTFIVAAAMEEDVWNNENEIISGKRTDEKWGPENYIADWLYNEDGTSWGTITWEEGYYFSSNVAMTYVLDAVGYDKWIDYATNKFEFGVPIEGIVDSSACDFSPEYDFETATTSFGQGMTANIMQILRAYTVFSNDGKMINPHIIKSVNDPATGDEIYNGISSEHPQSWIEGKDGVTVSATNGQYKKQVVSSKTAKDILKLMEGVMYYNEGGNYAGTGRSYGEEIKHRVAGKTGTSQIAINGSYDNNSGLYSAVIMAPADDPEIIMYTSLLNPSEQYPNQYIKLYMAPIIDDTLDYIDYENTQVTYKENSKEELVTVPRFVGLSETEISKIAAGKITYLQKGSGKIVAQYPQPGSKIDSQNKVLLAGENFKIEDLVGIESTDALNFCIITNNDCQLKGTGTKVSKIDVDKNNKYILTVK